MLRGIRKLINIRLFTSSKDPQSLKDQFKKMASQQDLKTEEKETNVNIKLTDHQKATDELKSKFDVFRSDLSKNTGQAKSVLEKLYETAKTVKAEDIKAHFKFNNVKENEKPAENTEKKDEGTIKFEENPEKATKAPSDSTSEPNKKETPNPEQAKNAKISKSYYRAFSEKYPRTSYHTDRIGKIVGQLWRETFPSQDEKILKLIKIHEMRKLSKEIDEKLARGEMTEDEIPAWKRSALALLEPKKSSWKKLQEKFGGGIVSEKTSSILQSDSVKQVKGKIKEIKDGVSDVKNLVNETIEESDSTALHKAKDIVRETFSETTEAKASRLMQQCDPDFNIYSMESELEDHIRNLFYHIFVNDSNYVKGVVGGQAKEYFERLLVKVEPHSDTNRYMNKIVNFSRISYLGSNCDDKNEPRITYSFKLAFTYKMKNIESKGKGENTEKNSDIEEEMKAGDLEDMQFLRSESSENFKKKVSRNFVVTIVPHEDPDILLHRHPWKFVVFYQAEKANRLTGSR